MEKCMHILPMNKVSGAEKLVLLLCKNMNNYKPIVICGGEELKKVFTDNEIESYAENFSNLNFIYSLIKLKKIIKQNNIKIIHGHDNSGSIIAYMLKKICRTDIKIISHIHGCYPFLINKNIYKKIEGLLRKKYDYSVACGKEVFEYQKNNSNYFNENRTAIMSNAIDVDYIENEYLNNEKKSIKIDIIPEDKIIIGFVGRLEKGKGLLPFIKKISEFKNEFQECKFILVGEGPQEDEIKKIINELELDELFILLGYQENVYDFYKIIDIFFLPSLSEGLPMTLLESMAFKKAIISMNVGSIKEIIKDCTTGILIDNQNYDKFVEKLIVLKNDRSIRVKMGNQAFDFLKSNFNIANYSNQVEKLYNKLLLDI